MSQRTVPTLSQQDIDELHGIGAALAEERDLDRLLIRILEKSRQIVRADAGSLFLVERVEDDQPTHLRFKLAQNDSISVKLDEFVIPVDMKSLAGYVASTRKTLSLSDVYQLDDSYPFQFNPGIDQETGYRSKSVLALPMVDHREQLIGIVQLWNKKKNWQTQLTKRNVAKEVLAFTKSDQTLLTSLTAQAAVAIENAKLYLEIKNLFVGFIRASAVAIESRDPATQGHSDRVAKLTVGLARAVDASTKGSHKNVFFTEDQLQEIEYAALLHDFGKIGVPEDVLLKSKKLYDSELAIFTERIDLLVRTEELETSQRKIAHLTAAGVKGDSTWKTIEQNHSDRMVQIQKAQELVLLCNEPTILPEEVQHDLQQLKDLSVRRPDGSTSSLLSQEQITRLAIPKGSLSKDERKQIEEHVNHTHEFLRRIPWTRELRDVPSVAHGHHEKLDGSGYPRGMKKADISVQARMMGIADIFDALAAQDRPYKKAMPREKALSILKMEADQNKLDQELVDLFIEREVYTLTTS